MSVAPDLHEELHAESYVRHRLVPCTADPFYLHLMDLRQAVGDAATGCSGRLLDLGCGGSPYRSLFQGLDYQCADLPGDSSLDYLLTPDGHVDAPAASFDVVLSTQVLEHVRDPQIHLREAARVMKDNGQLILSTHGIFVEHACPHDYRRWTAEGLHAELTDAGFSDIKVTRLTNGWRALAFCLSHWVGILLTTQDATTPSTLRRILHGLWRRCTPAFHYLVDILTPRLRCIPGLWMNSPLYIAILVVATKTRIGQHPDHG